MKMIFSKMLVISIKDTILGVFQLRSNIGILHPKAIFICLAAILQFCLLGPVFAATYYVSPSGSDTNPGSEALPWRTIQKAASTLVPGDICLVEEGTYLENVSITRSGLIGAPIVFKSRIPLKALIEGAVTITGNYVILDGFKIKLLDGSGFGISITGSNNEVTKCLATTDSTKLGLNNTGVGVSGNFNKICGNYVEKVCIGYGISGDSHLVENNEAYGLRLNGNCGDVDYMRFFGSNHIIRNNYFHGINLAEVGSAHVDCFQTFDNGGPSYAISNVVIENNYCSNAAQGMMLEGKLYKQSRGLIVRNNIFRNCGAWCVCLVDIADARFYNNTCDTTGGLHGIWCRGNGNVASCEFKNNIIYGTGTLYGVFETATIIDGTPDAPGKNNLLFRPGVTISGYSLDIKNQDPLFLNRELGDYRLKAGSPAIDSGIAIQSWISPEDKLGNPRPSGKGWDIGAYEYIFERSTLSPPKNLRIINE